jgi:Mak10 subunit, NatC N(alpha)-terminal acetyltransferase
MFGLLEAMSAIEMMDPKMDAGMVCNRGSKKALTFEQAVEVCIIIHYSLVIFYGSKKIQNSNLKLLQNCSLKLQDLTAKEQIGIMDSTLACVVSWLEGHSLAQTVFTNLYLHKPHQIEDRPMKAFSIAILKIIELIRSFVTKYKNLLLVKNFTSSQMIFFSGQWFLKRKIFSQSCMDTVWCLTSRTPEHLECSERSRTNLGRK